MPEAKTPDLERTRKRIIADHRKGKKPKELSEKYGVNINTVKSWIKRAKDKEGAPAPAPKKKDAKKKRTGAPLGNTNAVGNRGGTGPPLGSRNALKHGGYSPVYWDTLTEEERQLLADTEYDGEQMLMDEIALLSIRERRIMANIRKYSEAKGGQLLSGVVRSEEKREFANDLEREEYETRIQEKVDSGERLPGHSYNLSTKTEATYDVVHRLEEALTRCQSQKQRCIQNLNELRIARGEDGKAAPENNLLEALLAATSEGIDYSDIPELLQTTEHSDDMVEPSDSEGVRGDHL